MQTVPVYEWQLDGRGVGLGTKVEFDYWASEGVLADGTTLGDVLGYEPAANDETRKAQWGAA